MRTAFRTGFAHFLLLFAGFCFGGVPAAQSGSSADGSGSAWNQIILADCSFEKDPEKYTLGLRRTVENLSIRTDRFAHQIHIASARGSSVSRDDSSAAEAMSRGYVDDYIFRKMRADQVPHADPATDAEFLRRITLDLTGRIPSSENVRAFLADSNPNKRPLLVRALLASSEFTDKWTMFFGDLLKNTSADSFITRYAEGRNAFQAKIRDFVGSGMPYDVFVKNLLTASGSTWVSGEGNWEVGAFTPMGPAQDTYDTLAARASTEFLGLANMDCLLCHSGAGHLEKVSLWGAASTRAQAWSMAAFFSRYRAARSASQSTTSNLYYWTLSDVQNGDYQLNTTAGNRKPRTPLADGSKIVKPRYMFSDGAPQGSTYREMFANYIIKDRQFARATVNYLWKEMMGLGIVEPADQFDLARLDASKKLPDGWTLQPSHPELLEALADDFIRSGFDWRHILAVIADSNAYQLSSRFQGAWKPEYTPYFARKYIRRLTAEEVHDAIIKATGVPASYAVQGFAQPVEWAMQLPEVQGTNNAGEPRSNGGVAAFLNFFLRGNRDQIPRSDDATIFQALSMMNNNFVLSRIRGNNAASAVNRLLNDGALSNAQIVQELYLRTLGRLPGGTESDVAMQSMVKDRSGAVENLAWALLNKIDFLYNY